MAEKYKILVLAGVSGSGKTYLANSLHELNTKYVRLVQYTTRPKREEEVDGVDYHFITQEDFPQIKEDKHLQAITTIKGNSYGTPMADLQADKINIIVADTSGCIDLHNFSLTNLDKYDLKVVILHPMNNTPYATREGRDTKFIEQEWANLDSLSFRLPIVYRINNYNLTTGDFLTTAEAEEVLKAELKEFMD